MRSILEFYSGAGTDHRGRTLREIQGWSDDRLEAVHDYIQWLFPLPERSAFNAEAPVLDAETIAAFHYQDELRNSLARMLRFYGIGEPNFEERAKNWLYPGNHNHLRITRILKSLTLLGLEKEALSLFQSLDLLYRERPQTISAESYRFWKGSVTRLMKL